MTSILANQGKEV